MAGAAITSPAKAVDTVAYTWAVPCTDANGVGTEEHGIFFIPGVYAVTATGACTLSNDAVFGFGVTTPCSVVVVGPVPCVGVTVSNLPGEACWTTFSAAMTRPCDPAGVTVNGPCSPYTIRITAVTDTCLSAVPGAVGTVNINTLSPLSMRAVLVDCCYSDNTGYFVITATRI